MDNGKSEIIDLKVLVDKEKERVVFVELDKDFLDVLCSFMMMPMARIVRLTREQLANREVGCLSNLYDSIENLEKGNLQSPECREMLLDPRSTAEIYYRNLKVRLNESNANVYYACGDYSCNSLSYFSFARCCCGNSLSLKVKLPNPVFVPPEVGGFVKPTARFMLSDDFQVMPMSTMSALSLLCKLGISDSSKLEERMLNIGREEVLKLLKFSLESKTPFTDIFMDAPVSAESHSIFNAKYGARRKDMFHRAINPLKTEGINLKLIVNNYTNRAIYAEVKDDFVSLLCSFLTFPLGYVFREFPSLSFKGCLGNLYETIKDFDSKQFISEEMKEMIVNPKLAPGLGFPKQLIGIEEAVNPLYSTVECPFKKQKHEFFSESSTCGETDNSEGFIKGPSMFMVTDNLSIIPFSAISGISYINGLNIPLHCIEEWEINMGEDKALHLLVATLASKYALTDAFVLKQQKHEF